MKHALAIRQHKAYRVSLCFLTLAKSIELAMASPMIAIERQRGL
jgi:hypothetical protein